MLAEYKCKSFGIETFILLLDLNEIRPKTYNFVKMDSDNYFNQQVNFLLQFERVAEGGDSHPYTHLQELDTNQSYNCTNFRFLKTVYGRVVAVDLEDSWVILPRALSSIVKTEEHLKMLNALNYRMRYLGQDSTRGNKHLIKFDEVSLNPYTAEPTIIQTEEIEKTVKAVKAKKPSIKVSYAEAEQPISFAVEFDENPQSHKDYPDAQPDPTYEETLQFINARYAQGGEQQNEVPVQVKKAKISRR